MIGTHITCALAACPWSAIWPIAAGSNNQDPALLRDRRSMTLVGAERAVGSSVDSNTASPYYVESDDAQETTPDASSAKPKASLSASALQFQPGLFSPLVHDVVVLRASRSARQPRTVPYRMPYSCASSNVGSDHLEPTMSQLIADLPSGLTI